MNVTRRSFIGGAAALGAAGCARHMPVIGWQVREREPNLTLGVVSDVHVTFVGGKDVVETGWGNEDALRRALAWYRDQGVDAVAITGDLAEFGLVDQVKAVADVWEEVFPGDRSPDGRRVEKLFITGNHDFEGPFYEYARKFLCGRYPGAREDFPAWCRENALRADIPGLWKRFFHEDYARFFRKDVKGYAFLCQNWDDGTGVEAGLRTCEFGPLLKGYLDAHGRELDPARPFFYLQHPHPKGTCYGDQQQYGGKDLVTETLSRWPNAVAISGHSHFTLADERSAWRGAFASVGAGSLRYVEFPSGYDAASASRWSRQGMLWKVYDDRIVVRRREFLLGRELGPDWVIPIAAS